MNEFRKRFFTRPSELFKEAGKIKKSFKLKKKIGSDEELDANLNEKIMLAVCAVNNCRHCSYLHTKTSLENGVSSKEIKNILEGELQDFPEEEAKALAYAQHITESRDNISEEARRKVVEYYGEAKTVLIELAVQMVYIGNMICNTVEAFKYGVRPESGRLKFLIVYLLSKPVEFFIRKSGKKGEKFLSENNITI